MISERIDVALLRVFCRPVGSPDYAMKGVHYEGADTLSRTTVFPDFDSAIRGKDFLDFGCGYGYQTIAFAQRGVKSATGVEIQSALLESAKARAAAAGVTAAFLTHMEGSYDVIYSQNSFEHFLDADQICSDMLAHLRPGGRIYITFGCPWFAPYGAHMGFFTRLPWVNVFFPERVVMAVRASYRSDGARTYRETGMGKMSIKRFEATIKRTGLRIEFCRYFCARGMNFLGRIPMLRELFINRVACILARQ